MSEQRTRRRVPSWLTFTLLRLAFFAVPLVVVYGLSANILLAAGVAAVVALCLSVIFLNRQRSGLVDDLRAYGARRHTVDESAEDAEVEGAPVRTRSDEDAEDADVERAAPSPARPADAGLEGVPARRTGADGQSTSAAASPRP